VNAARRHQWLRDAPLLAVHGRLFFTARTNATSFVFGMPDIVLATLNAKYIHSAFGLRYLLANLGEMQSQAALLEFDLKPRPVDLAEALLARSPKIIGLGVYIWNITEITALVAALKQLRPDVTIILGGPEVSFETDTQPVVGLADYVITGEADLTFPQVCHRILQGDRPPTKIIPALLPDLARLELPYDLYTDQDLAKRVIYVEASRGCPFSCEFCLSSLDIPVRPVPEASLRNHLQKLLDRGARQLKFVDRTFNLNIQTSQTLLQFLLERCRPGHFFHFEMIPDRFPGELREVIARFPPGVLQLEMGIQSFNEQVCQRIRRRQDVRQAEDNFRFLRTQTGVHIHADLIVGLPGESLESFAAGFDRLVGLGPQEIQVGMLKRLRGTPIGRHDTEWPMIYNPGPPYEILQNRFIPFADMQRLRRFARYWDLVANSGNFIESTPLLWSRSSSTLSPFAGFLEWSDWLYRQAGRTDAIALPALAAWLFQYLLERGHDPTVTAQILTRDYQRGGRRDLPVFLRPYLPASGRLTQPATKTSPAATKRQARHLA
jgi:radical SAM superfamily enzyme YgiQ (UPF0313 family)